MPSEKVVELVKRGKKKTSSRKFFPGYILVNMVLNDETWHIVKSQPQGDRLSWASTAARLPPIPEAEVREIAHQMEEGAVKRRSRR